MKRSLFFVTVFVLLINLNFGCGVSETEVLIVMDNDAISNYEDLTAVTYYESILGNMSFGNGEEYNITTWNEELEGVPSLSYLQEFGVVIWTAGDYTYVVPSSSDITTIENYVKQGGNLIISGAWLLNDYGQNSYTDNVLHANAPAQVMASLKDVNVTNVSHAVTFGFAQDELLSVIASPTGQTDYRPDVIEDVVNGGQILSVRGSLSTNSGAPVIVVFENETNAARVVYISFPIFLLNETNRTHLVENSMSWMDNYAPVVGAVNVSSSSGGDDLDPDVQVDFVVNVTDLHNVSAVKMEYRCAAGVGLCSPGTEDFSSVVMNYNDTTNIYENASFIPDVPGVWQYRIWANDTLGNHNYGDVVNLSIEYDYSWTKSFDGPESVSCLFSDSCVLGNLTINNIGDFELDFELDSNYEDIVYNVTSSFSLAAKDSKVIQIIATAGEVLSESNIVITVNAISANADPSEDYVNVTFISFAGGVYLSNSLVDYVGEVSQGESINLSGFVKNFGNETALGTFLKWEMPSSSWVNSSGNLTQYIGNLTENSLEFNNITISVPSSISTGLYNIYLNSTCDNNVSGCSDVESFSIFVSCSDIDGVCGQGCTFQNDNDCPEQVVVSSGGGGGSSSSYVIEFSKTIEVLRGEGEEFEVEINNTYKDSVLENLTLSIIGFPSQYVFVSPDMISKIEYGKSDRFVVKLKVPSYEGYREFILNATVSGFRVNPTTSVSYTEKQYIKLISQEVSRKESNATILEARKAIDAMKESGFNIRNIEKLFDRAKAKLEDRRNKEAQNLALEIIQIKIKAFFVEDLIKRVQEVLENPRRINLLSGEVIKSLQDVSRLRYITGNVVFQESSAEDMASLALVAFDRGDYDLAEERIKFAQFLVLFDRKGNLALFLYFYWHYVLISFIFLLVTGGFVYKKHQKSSITQKIDETNKRERSIEKLMVENQKTYFSKKIDSGKYHAMVSQYQKKLTQIKKMRINLRNKRVKMLKSWRISTDLKNEAEQVTSEIKKLQRFYYKDNTISPSEYNLQFKMLNERIAEIENEKITLSFMRKHKSANKSKSRVFVDEMRKWYRGKFRGLVGVAAKLSRKLKMSSLGLGKDKRGIVLIDSDLIERIKEHVKDKDCRGKWVHIKYRGERNGNKK